MGVGFNNTCAVSEKWNVFRVIARHFGWAYKNLRLSPLVVEKGVVVMSVRLNPMDSQFWFPFYLICVQNQWGHKLWTQLRTPKLAVGVQLLLGWNTYLLFNTDILNLVQKTNEGGVKSIVLLIFLLWFVFGWGVVRWRRKPYLGPAEIASFSTWDFSRSSKRDTFWHVLTTGYFYGLLLWTIAVSDFVSCKIIKT